MKGHAAPYSVWCAWTARQYGVHGQLGHKTAAGFELYTAAAAAPTRQNTSLLRSAVGAPAAVAGERDGMRRSMHGVRGAAGRLQFSSYHASLLGLASQLLQQRCRTGVPEPLRRLQVGESLRYSCD